jgi:hypothetical protein
MLGRTVSLRQEQEMQRKNQILTGALLATVILGCVKEPPDKPLPMTAMERAALDEQALQKKPEVRTDQMQSLPGPMPSEPLPAMTGPRPRGMDSDLVEKKSVESERSTPMPEEPQPPEKN